MEARDLLRRGYILLTSVPDVEAYSLREGYGDGYGFGYGYGTGFGFGNGGGYGFGSKYGYGFGSKYGYGFGYELGDRRGNGGE